ncbi:hypothetical protein [Nocardioides sp.]|uniref:hypothetical protein n=1 Tax=Nocardioides sp. TaxID=35761 RepID=UPI002ED81758
MSTLGRQTLLWMIPVNLVLVAWVWSGRIVFGVGGWFLLILLVSVVPIALVALLVTTVLAYTQDGRPRALTPLQAWAQLGTWAGLFVLGAFMPDFGDTEDSRLSVLTQVFGYSDAIYDLSFLVALAGAVVAIAAYAVLFGALVFARRRTPVLA